MDAKLYLITIFTVVNGLLLLANIGLVALGFKLYTEYFKDKSMGNRMAKKEETPS